jgi:hypothetical protein
MKAAAFAGGAASKVVVRDIKFQVGGLYTTSSCIVDEAIRLYQGCLGKAASLLRHRSFVPKIKIKNVLGNGKAVIFSSAS